MMLWLIPLGIVCVLVGTIAFLKILEGREDEKAADTANWPETEATIQQGRMDAYDRQHWYPCFAFSYAAAGEYFSGEFYAQIEGGDAEDLIKKLLGRRFTINYDPKRPSSWYIPDESIDEYRILVRELLIQ